MSATVDTYESIQKANQSGLFINLNFGQESGFTSPTWAELDLVSKAEVGATPETKELKVRRVTRSGSTAETVKSSKWAAKADLNVYKLSQTTPEANAFHMVKEAYLKKPIPGMVDILHVEELDAGKSYATRAICIIKAGTRSEDEDNEVSQSLEFTPGVNAFMDSEYTGKCLVLDGEPTGFLLGTATTGTWDLSSV